MLRYFSKLMLAFLMLNSITPIAGWTNRLLVISHVAFALHAAPPSPPKRPNSAFLSRAQSNEAYGAFVFDLEAADTGDAAAQCQLARAYRTGDGVTQSASEAARWFRKAADQGHPEAQFNLGVCFAKGFGVEQDLACAADWLQAAAEQGHERALAACTRARSEALALRVVREAEIMPTPSPLLPPPVPTDSNNTRSITKDPSATSDAEMSSGAWGRAREAALAQHGVVRINGALSPSTAASLRKDILLRRASAYAAVASGAQPPDFEFGTFMQYAERCDLLLPLEGNYAVQCALRELLCGKSAKNLLKSGLSSDRVEGSSHVDARTPLCDLLLATVGEDAVLYELAALISEPGAPRQPVHSDSPWQATTSHEPPLLTSFVALQPVAHAMGPTLFLPGTHGGARGGEAHAAYSESTASLDALLSDRPNVEALLNIGDVSCFDSRTLHCGSANAKQDGSTRALFYVSFLNPRAAQPIGTAGSLRSDVKPITLMSLRAKLSQLGVGGDDSDPFACDDESAGS